MPRVQPDGDRPLLYPCVGKWPTIFLVYTVTLSLTATTGARAKVDPKALRTRHFAANARGDVAGALALDTEDAVIDGTVGLCVAAPCVGKTAIQKEVETPLARMLVAGEVRDGKKVRMDVRGGELKFEVESQKAVRAS